MVLEAVDAVFLTHDALYVIGDMGGFFTQAMHRLAGGGGDATTINPPPIRCVDEAELNRVPVERLEIG